MWKVNKHIPSTQASDKNKTRSKTPKSQNLSELRKRKGKRNEIKIENVEQNLCSNSLTMETEPFKVYT